MALTVNSNIQALNAYRNLNKTQSSLSTSLEKLSSGLRINRAADDAAGLAISEGFKAQIGGIQQASKNAQDGVSLVQTADGALAETQTILQRLRTLAVSSANGSQSDTSRAAINSEATSLKAELTRIAQTSNFNGVNLLDGTLKAQATFQIGYRADSGTVTGNTIAVGVDSGSAASTIAAASATRASFTAGATQTFATTNYDFTVAFASATYATLVGTAATGSFGFNFATSNLQVTVTFGGTAYSLTVTTNVTNAAGLAASLTTLASATIGANKLVFAVSGSGLIAYGSTGGTAGTSNTVTVNSIVIGASAATDYGLTGSATGTAQVDGKSLQLVVSLDGTAQTITLASSYATTTAFLSALNTAASTAYSGANKLSFAYSSSGQITVSAGVSDTVAAGALSRVAITSITLGAGVSNIVYGLTVASSQGVQANDALTTKAGSFDAFGLGVFSLDLSTQSGGISAITSIDTAITQVSTARASLGALQNRFQYTVDNLDTTAENLSAAQSRILDTDMASEMVNFTRSQILSQAGSSMLAQAKNLPSSILDLLKS